MSVVTPSSTEELSEALRAASSQSQSIQLYGNNSKSALAGPQQPADVTLSTKRLNRILQYEPNDLTIGVEAGASYASVQSALAEHGQMIALDPPFAADATIGGVVAANSSGPMRRLYGTARDLVIGMTFVTLEGKLITSGGMVVKNVAGFDMAKLLIGSFGTLAAITRINFRVHPRPHGTRTFLYSYPNLESAIERRDATLRGVLTPMALDLLSPVAAARFHLRGHTVALRAGGSERVLARYSAELNDAVVLEGAAEQAFWRGVREFVPDFISRQPNAVVLRVSTKLTDVAKLHRLVSDATVTRAASGISYVCLPSYSAASPILKAALANSWAVMVQCSPQEVRTKEQLWFGPQGEARDNAFDIMKKVKGLFDPANLLNRSRMYGRI